VSLSELIDGNDVSLEEMLASKDADVYNGLDARLLGENAALKDLGERERLLVQYSMDGLTVREIGERLGVSHVMVVKMRSKIRKKLHSLKTG
jgi:RNA polymerase sigma factor (sigma-70 family)